jgi:hypothetical protein
VPLGTEKILDLSDVYFGTVPVKLKTARDLYRRFNGRLQADISVRKLQPIIEGYARELQELMLGMGLPELCCQCGSRPTGGCCSLEMAGESDALLLLANMLMGCHPEMRKNGEECCFLGPHGCSLRLKPIFCLNYNCHHILRSCSPGALQALEAATGRLLTAQTELEQALLSSLRSKPAEVSRHPQ